MRSLCVYCGSSMGASETYAAGARELAAEMVRRDVALVYGGGNVGLMGVIADEVMRLGGRATGVIPQALMQREVGHHGLTELHVVKDMHERKALMAELSDGFIAMPGGFGTLEELFEVTTWCQLGLHAKPIGLLNIDGFYDGLITFRDHMVQQAFVRGEHAALLMHAPHAADLLDQFDSYEPTHAVKWLERGEAKKIVP
ncbi:LOG family protein [Noviherbaspirillum pedocola]|uniref:Cytokinin riboside 5'-monophosphate phosphoribohydrolase n=1 Tax=Noviherbaspirillum pedocola TaxID=2801341 RepID=A0A934SRT2_9BURK|nr:TIGR00730 family Rossman fold protein [Noviherbaspirillum pedocola]MBK4734088.1 TIGR00730 family Rossman fold protein [Noviherbaspirillum pedocola]